MQLAEWLDAPVATTLQGLSVFPANHPLHAGFGFGASAVPAAQNAFRHCDCMIAIGTRFAEIATGSFGAVVPENLDPHRHQPGRLQRQLSGQGRHCGRRGALF